MLVTLTDSQNRVKRI